MSTALKETTSHGKGSGSGLAAEALITTNGDLGYQTATRNVASRAIEKMMEAIGLLQVARMQLHTCANLGKLNIF